MNSPAIAILAVALSAPVAAQWLNLPTPGLPRTPDGKPNLAAPTPRTADGKPDLSGLWTKISPKYSRNIAADLKPGEVEPWGTLAAIDQVFRLWSGKAALPATETGPAAYLVTPSNTPDHSTTSVSYGKLDRWALAKFDYLAPYEKAWGVNLHSVIQDES